MSEDSSHAQAALLHIVLVQTSHPGNIGATARAMATMGFAQLALADPGADPRCDEAVARASGAHALLRSALTYPDLAAAIGPAQHAYAFSARRRGLSQPVQDVRAACRSAAAQLANGLRVAFVFGPEKTGLDNRQITLCDRLVEIPCAAGHASLNVAAAVQVACYELRMNCGVPITTQTRQPASKHDHQQLLAHLEQVIAARCPPKNAGLRSKMLKRLALLLARAEPDSADVRMLRGLLKLAAKTPKG